MKHACQCHQPPVIHHGFDQRPSAKRYAIARDMADRRAAAEREVAELEVRRAALEEQVQYITSERGIEAEMRRQFDIAREGERVVIILDEPASPAP